MVTAKARELVGRLGDAACTPGSTRAWSLTGPYGGGKSAFALFAAHLFRSERGALGLLEEADAEAAERFREALPGPFCPILVVGSRRPLREALLTGLAEGLEAFAASLHRKRGRPAKATREVQEALRAIGTEAAAVAADVREDGLVLDLFDRASACVHAFAGGGLFLVVDELGKLLEHVALYPDRGDLFILQSLAERASRSGGGGGPHLLVLTILHQAFERYAARLSRDERDEWRKVQGRYEDVAFVEPVGETLRLLASAVERTGDKAALPEESTRAVEAVLGAAQLPARIDPGQVRDHLLKALPLHPAVALLVGPLFRRLAQNERSLFAFLASGEPHSFLGVVGRSAEGSTDDSQLSLLQVPEAEAVPGGGLPLYRLDHLYDYLTGALGGALFHEHVGRLWAETEAALSSVPSATPLAERLLKQIALLSFAGSLAGLPPSRDVLLAAADAPEADVDAALAALVEARAVTYRPFRQEYRVWQGSDFDLEAELVAAREEVPVRTPLADLLARTVPPAPVVARRHAYRTGTTRVFEVHYANEASWRPLLQEPSGRADGRIIYVLPEHEGEVEALTETLRAASEEMGEVGRLTLLAVPDGAAGLRETVHELALLDWVRRHAKALEGDSVARREVDEQRADLAAHLQQRLSMLLAAGDGGENPCLWIRGGEVFRIEGRRGLQGTLSDLSDEVFSEAPEVWNELLNRRSPSSSAVRGQKLLIKAMLERAGEARLGIEGHPAEYGMYASVLAATGMHREVEPRRWAFAQPDAETHPGCAAVWEAVETSLEAAEAERVTVDVLFDRLRQPPLGVREGLLPLFLFAVVKAHEEEVAFFENGVFAPALDFEAVERLLRNPVAFALQWVAIDEARAGVLGVLAPLVGLPGGRDRAVPKPLPVVLRILGKVSTLPPYVRKTSGLSDTSVAVREALVSATEPASLLFRDLPEACGVGSFLEDVPEGISDGIPDGEAEQGTLQDAREERARAYGEALMEALRELGGAYEGLLRDIEDEVAGAFHLRAEAAEERRHELAERARAVLPGAVEARLKSFAVRAADEILDTRAWYESLAALLVRRPPAQWADEDRRAFPLELQTVARLFLHREALGFDAYEEPKDAAEPAERIERIRLSVTATYEEEREAVFHVHREDAGKVETVVERVVLALDRGTESLETKLAALGRLSLALMEQREGNPDPLRLLLSGLQEERHPGSTGSDSKSTDSEAAT